MEFPGKDLIRNPVLELVYEIEIRAQPEDIWPWIIQVGYHRAGWYIDTWWDKCLQKYFWPLIVPKEARGIYKPPADEILPEYQNLVEGDIVPDGPPCSAYYQIVKLEQPILFLLYATTHFKYMAPQFIYKTRYSPAGAFCWAFIINRKDNNTSQLISWWQAQATPRKAFLMLKSFFVLADGAHQKHILHGVKRRVESAGDGIEDGKILDGD